jgi:hypothetical protein
MVKEYFGGNAIDRSHNSPILKLGYRLVFRLALLLFWILTQDAEKTENGPSLHIQLTCVWSRSTIISTHGLSRRNSMLQTLEAIVDERGQVRLAQPIKLPPGRRALVIILDEPALGVSETALLSEQALAEDWDRPEEDKAWSHLQHLVSS